MLTPSIVPSGGDTVFLVEDDYGAIGRSWRETDSAVNPTTALNDLYSGQFNDPIRVIPSMSAKAGPETSHPSLHLNPCDARISFPLFLKAILRSEG